MSHSEISVAFIGSAGVPNRYGGFESFLEHCGPLFCERVSSIIVTCDKAHYPDLEPKYKGITRVFISLRANGWQSVFHDALAFIKVFPKASHVVVLGVSAGLWFPLMRILCALSGKRLIVNVDGIEWRRSKYSYSRRIVLRIFDALAQIFADVVIVDNEGLLQFLTSSGRAKATLIAYSGDHVEAYFQQGVISQGMALTICRIEPENQLEILIEAAIASSYVSVYTIVGNWAHSRYGLTLYAKYKDHPKLRFCDPIYDLDKLGRLRSACQYYLHGHSVGGTNPSLVEMLFYDCDIFAFDCSFNRATAGAAAGYFLSTDDLVQELARPRDQRDARCAIRKRYTAKDIVDQYINAMSEL